MSEYQYYEFQAIDRPLTEKEMRELRAYSTRARITPTSFINDYSWGNFKGDEDAWMEKYFDAFLYVANWGTRVLKLRLPSRLLDLETAHLYCPGEQAFAREKSGKVILTFVSEDEGGGEWVEGEGWLSSLISVRAELARGDMRCLYLGWLLCAQSGELDDEDVEPPVPPGLGQLSASLESLVEFLRIDTDLLHVAARASQPMVDVREKQEEIRKWVGKLQADEKDDVLARLIAGEDLAPATELLRRFIRECDQEGQRLQNSPGGEPWANFSAQPKSMPRNAASLLPRRLQRRRRDVNGRRRSCGRSTSTRSPDGSRSCGTRSRT